MGAGAGAQVVGIVVSAFVGLAIGSFVNVVVWRLPRGISIVEPPSHCPACRTRLTALDMVPVLSWLALRGRCRHCGSAISPRYPAIELATGAAFAGLAAAFGTLAPLASLAVVTACAVAAGAIDADGLPVPAAIGVIGAAAAVSLVAVALTDGHPGRIAWAALGAAVSGAAAFAGGRPSTTAGRWSRLLVTTTVGWSVGWVWPLGGVLVAVWVVGTRLATSGLSRRTPLALTVAGAYCLLVAGAALART